MDPGVMCVEGTPLEPYPELGLWVKREDMCCPGGPNFSKTRGVYQHVKNRPEHFICVLDTSHSQGGWAVARACKLLGKQCVLFFPARKTWDGTVAPQQLAAQELGAQLLPLRAGRSAILYHHAKKWMGGHAPFQTHGTYMMPNALKLPESVTETAVEVDRTPLPPVSVALVSASSGTIAAGVALGLADRGMRVIVHLGYSRSEAAVRKYISQQAYAGAGEGVDIIDEGYSYADKARPGLMPPFPCNEFYDLKALRWWLTHGHARYGDALFWNVG